MNDGYLGSGTAIKNAIKKYGKENFKKLILCFCDSEEEAFICEKIFARKQVINNNMCYNLQTGGLGGVEKTEEIKEKFSNIQKRLMTPERRKQISDSLKGKKQSKETIAKRVEKLKGKKCSDTKKQKISDSEKGKKVPQEVRDKLSITKRKENLSPETLKKMSDAKKGRKLTEKTKNKMSEARKKVYKWLDMNGNIHFMCKSNAKRYHKDWIMLE